MTSIRDVHANPPRTLDELKDRHLGRLAIVAGAGPSLRHVDWSQISDQVVIAVNSAIAKFPLADYFVSISPDITRWTYWHQALTGPSTKVLVRPFAWIVGEQPPPGVLLMDMRRAHPGLTSSAALTMSTNPRVPMISSSTGLGWAVNLALILGCSPIVLLGADATTREGHAYYHEYEGQAKVETVPGREPHPLAVHVRHNEAHGRFWDLFAEANGPHLGRIINASHDTAVTAIRRVNLDAVLADPSSFAHV